MNITAVCLNCEERHTACHGSCAKYQEAKKEYLEKNAAIKKQSYEGYAATSVLLTHRNKFKKKRWRK